MATPLWAKSGALIVSGLSGSSENAEEFQRLAAETKRLLVERGIGRVEVLGGKVTRDAVFEKLKEAASASPDDEFWLILFGMSSRGQGGVPAFQVSGPRLTADDLKRALDAIPARQFVFLGTSNSGGFLPVLQSEQRAVLSATKAQGEEDWPRFPEKWVSAFSENPKAAFPRIAARAAALVEEEYTSSSLAQAEHARLADPVTGTILEPPFGVNLEAAPEHAQTVGGPESQPAASHLEAEKVRIRKPDAEWELQPATAETKKIMEEARAIENPAGHSAVVLEQRLAFTVEADRTTDELVFWRVFIARDEAVADWANPTFPQFPPAVTTRLEVARVIQPDGSAIVFNPEKLRPARDPETGASTGSMMVFLPGAKAGCVIEIGYRTREMLNAALPHVSETLPLLRGVPVQKTRLEVRVPEKPEHRVVLNNVAAPAQESSEHGRRVYRWEIGPLAAAEALPGDPPWIEWAPYVAISSLPSWEAFAQWYRRLAKGSDEIDDTVKAMAAQLAEGAGSRLEKIRRDFEFVSALRYVAIEIGVQGFRPRTPAQVLANRYGDCKDKANLLCALLRCQGITGHLVLLNRGAATDTSFPSWQFNHAIAFVPKAPQDGQPEDLWLDATDSVTPFGFVPPGDSGRAGLVFDGEKAEFKMVAGGAGAVTEIRDEWDLVRQEDEWKGSFRRETKGLSDDQLRRIFRGLTPAQRQSRIHQMLSELWNGGDFSNGLAGDTSALGQPMSVRAEVLASAGTLPGLTTPEFEIFSAPERPRPLWLNDGQPMVLQQTVRLRQGGPETLPPPFQAEAAGEKLSVVWKRDGDGSIVRTARLDLLQPVVATADYAPLRRAIREWKAVLWRDGQPESRGSQNR